MVDEGQEERNRDENRQEGEDKERGGGDKSTRRPRYTKLVNIKKKNPWESDDELEDCQSKIPQSHYFQTPENGWFRPDASFWKKEGEADEETKEGKETKETTEANETTEAKEPTEAKEAKEAKETRETRETKDGEDGGGGGIGDEGEELVVLHYPEDDEAEEEETNPPKESTRFHPRLGVHIYKAQAKRLKTNMYFERKKHKSLYKRFVKDILQYYDDYKQDDKTLERKDEVMLAMQKEMENVFPLNSVRIFAIGPTADGCGAKTSGLDATIVLDEKFPDVWDDRPIRRTVNQTREYQLDCLDRMNRHLTGPNRHNTSLKVIDFIQSDPEDVADSEIVLGPELPFLRVSYRTGKSLPRGERDRGGKNQRGEPAVYMNVFINDVASIYNSHLIYNYTKVDKRFPEITLAIKGWAANNLASKQGPQFLNSPTICLMVIHYLQSGIEPPVLPNLHYLHPKQFGEQATLWESDLRAPGKVQVPEWRNNGTPIHEQLVGFFHYFANVDYRRKAISIRLAKILDKSDVEDPFKSHIVIEDPFKLRNSTRVVNAHIYRKIVTAFCAGALAMTNKPIMDRLLEEDMHTRPNIRGREMREVRMKHHRYCDCRLDDEEDNTLEIGEDGESIPCPASPPRPKGVKKPRVEREGRGPEEKQARRSSPQPLMGGRDGRDRRDRRDGRDGRGPRDFGGPGGRRQLAHRPPSQYPNREGMMGGKPYERSYGGPQSQMMGGYGPQTGPYYGSPQQYGGGGGGYQQQQQQQQQAAYDPYYYSYGQYGTGYYGDASSMQGAAPPPPSYGQSSTYQQPRSGGGGGGRAAPPQLDPTYADFYSAYSYNG